MNKTKFSKEISELSELYGNVLMHPSIIPEIFDIVLGSGYESEFLKQFAKQLKNVDTLGRQVVELNSFELLKGGSDIYSMHLKSKSYNIRILYSYLDNGELLLHCFYEKQGKRITEYERSIPIAIERKKWR